MCLTLSSLTAGICLFLATPTLSYVRTTAPGNREPARWAKSQVRLEWAPSELPEGLAADEVRHALKIASDAWSYPAVGCTSAKIERVERPKMRSIAHDKARETHAK